MKKHLRIFVLSAIVCIMLFSSATPVLANYNDAIARDLKQYPLIPEGEAFERDFPGLLSTYGTKVLYPKEDGSIGVARIIVVFVSQSAYRYEMVDENNLVVSYSAKYKYASGHWHNLAGPIEERYFHVKLPLSAGLSTQWYYLWTGIYPPCY